MRLCSYLVLIFAIFFLSCSNDSNYPDGEITESFEQDYSRNFGFSFDNDTIIDEAMEALNTIQITGDGKMMLYLTFPNIDHQECQGEVSSYEISKEELHDALIDVMAKNNLTLTKKKRFRLAAAASSPRELYTVQTCVSTTEPLASTEGKIPLRKGTWIITAIFGRSDLLINW